MKPENPLALESKKESLNDCLYYFKNERDNCIDDLPPKPVSIEDPNYGRYKCRTIWWTGIIHKIDLIQRKKLIEDDTLNTEVSKFMLFVSSIDFKKLRVKEDIDKANILLDKLIEYLESAVNKE